MRGFRMQESIKKTNRYVAYYRVSTKKQPYGVDVQKDVISNFLTKDEILVAEYEDKTSGRDNERDILKDAILACKENKANLIVAKLDRLSRDVSYIFQIKAMLEDNKIELVCCDLPIINTLTLGLYATIAQYEAELISNRTKETLKMLKDKGVKLGNPRPKGDKSRIKGGQKRTRAIKNRLEGAWNLTNRLRKQGYSAPAIANELNNKGFKTSKGGTFNRSSVYNLIKLFTY